MLKFVLFHISGGSRLEARADVPNGDHRWSKRRGQCPIMWRAGILNIGIVVG